MLRITDKAFRYTPSHETDLKAKFAKIIAEQKAAAEQQARAAQPSTVTTIKRAAK
jgi:hypothetical protein